MPRKRAQRVVVTVFKKVFLGKKVVVERVEIDKSNSDIVMNSRFNATDSSYSAEVSGTQLAFRHLRQTID